MTVDPSRRLVLGPLILAIVLALTACGKRAAEEVESETVVVVKTVAAATGDIRGVVHATGIVNPAPGAELVVVPPEAARIAELPYAVGDRVRKGDVLVRFDIPSSAAEAQKQRAEVERAQTVLDTVRAAQARARQLFERGVAARKEVEDTNRAIADAEAALAQARAALAASEALASRAVVRATFDGVVAKRQHNPGDLVEPSATDPVLRVIDPRRLEMLAAIPLADAAHIRVGAAARLAPPPAGASDVDLKVVSRPVAVEPGTPTTPIRLSFAGATNIPSGTPVQVDIDGERHAGVVLVPSVAIVREGDETAVFVVDDKKAKRRPVQIGLTDGEQVEIVSGVKAGDQVIVDGQAGLPDEATVTVNNEGDAPKEPAARQPAAKPAAKDDGQ